MVSETMDASPLTEIPANSAILIAGPPMTGKYDLLLQLLPQFGDRIIIVSTKNGCRRIVDDFPRGGGQFDESRLGIVDCISYHDPIDVDEVPAEVRLADTPENLTRIGVRFTELFDQFLDTSDTIAVGIHSVSQLLMHSEVREVYRFLQILVGQIRNEGHFVAAVVEASTTDDETMQVLQQHFDGLINTRENEGGVREFRIRGLGSSASPWTEF